MGGYSLSSPGAIRIWNGLINASQKPAFAELRFFGWNPVSKSYVKEFDKLRMGVSAVEASNHNLTNVLDMFRGFLDVLDDNRKTFSKQRYFPKNPWDDKMTAGFSESVAHVGTAVSGGIAADAGTKPVLTKFWKTVFGLIEGAAIDTQCMELQLSERPIVMSLWQLQRSFADPVTPDTVPSGASDINSVTGDADTSRRLKALKVDKAVLNLQQTLEKLGNASKEKKISQYLDKANATSAEISSALDLDDATNDAYFQPSPEQQLDERVRAALGATCEGTVGTATATLSRAPVSSGTSSVPTLGGASQPGGKAGRKAGKGGKGTSEPEPEDPAKTGGEHHI